MPILPNFYFTQYHMDINLSSDAYVQYIVSVNHPLNTHAYAFELPIPPAYILNLMASNQQNYL